MIKYFEMLYLSEMTNIPCCTDVTITASVTKVNSLDICNVVQKRLIMVLCRGTKKLSQLNELQCQLCKKMLQKWHIAT